MKNDLTELVFILDRSGSMAAMAPDTIGGYNSLINKQKQQEGKCNITTILFDDRIEYLHKSMDLNKVQELTEKDYYVRGSTALIDAIGTAVDQMIEKVKKARFNKPGKIMFVITTDGYENASRKYSADQVRKMISVQQEKYGWEFIFLGANIDAVATANQYGIHYAADYRNDSQGVKYNFEAMSDMIQEYRVCQSVNENYLKAIEKNYQEHKDK